MPINITDLHAPLPYTPEQIRTAFHAVFRNSPEGRIVYEVMLIDWCLSPTDESLRSLGLRDAFGFINGMLAEFDQMTEGKADGRSPNRGTRAPH